MPIQLTKKERESRPERQRFDDIEVVLKALGKIGIPRETAMRVFSLMDEDTEDLLK
jgi:hypothetical protein